MLFPQIFPLADVFQSGTEKRFNCLRRSGAASILVAGGKELGHVVMDQLIVARRIANPGWGLPMHACSSGCRTAAKITDKCASPDLLGIQIAETNRRSHANFELVANTPGA